MFMLLKHEDVYVLFFPNVLLEHDI